MAEYCNTSRLQHRMQLHRSAPRGSWYYITCRIQHVMLLHRYVPRGSWYYITCRLQHVMLLDRVCAPCRGSWYGITYNLQHLMLLHRCTTTPRGSLCCISASQCNYFNVMLMHSSHDLFTQVYGLTGACNAPRLVCTCKFTAHFYRNMEL